MAFLESELFRYSSAAFEEEQEAVSLHEARNPRAEAQYVAEEIRRLVRTKGYRYREIAVIGVGHECVCRRAGKGMRGI